MFCRIRSRAPGVLIRCRPLPAHPAWNAGATQRHPGVVQAYGPFSERHSSSPRISEPLQGSHHGFPKFYRSLLHKYITS